MGLAGYNKDDDNLKNQLSQTEIESILRTLKNSKVMGFSIEDIEPLYNAINKLKEQRQKIIDSRGK